ncbi:hypothetical protein EN792_062075 [Mesorhizobium sp. M00.F.Ca.ET.149.01.1.1]|nr:hypothetical protein EN792_062075 [Mesorhizobium sp. M00.F.Ca.ET.149.01.1.1]
MALVAGSTTRLWTLVAKEFWRKTRRRLRAGPVYRWRYSGRTPELLRDKRPKTCRAAGNKCQ